MLHFTENKSYDKYIRILCNIMVLSLVVVPVMELFRGDTTTQINQLIHVYEQQLLDIDRENRKDQNIREAKLKEQREVSNDREDSIQNLIQDNIPKEIKSKLNNSKLKNEGYQVTEVTICGVDTDGIWDEDEFCIQVEIHRKNVGKVRVEIGKQDTEKQDTEMQDAGKSEQEKLRNLCAEILETDIAYVEVSISE